MLRLNKSGYYLADLPSIYPSSSVYPGSGQRGSSLSREAQTSLCITSFSSRRGSRGVPRPAERYKSLQLGSSLGPATLYGRAHFGRLYSRCCSFKIGVGRNED